MVAGAESPSAADAPIQGSSSRPESEVLAAGGCQWVCQLGRGQYGTVHLVNRQAGPRDEPHEAVAKVVFLDHLKDRDRALAQQEVEVLRRLQHPNIVQHYASWLHHSSAGAVARGSRSEALVTLMEYCAGGDLRQWLDDFAGRQEYLPENKVLNLFTQMLEGIRYVHGLQVLHRDLKTSNLLLTEDRSRVKIGDFGIARVLDNTAAVAVTMLGTPYYMSPEVCKGESYREKSDMWSLGCVLYEMCMLRHAFESQSLLGLVYCIVSESYAPIPSDRYSPEVRELVSQFLIKAADERPNADTALAFEVLRPYVSSPAPSAEELAEAPSSAVPPPPPPPLRHAYSDDLPLPPPSPGGGAGIVASVAPLLPPPTPPGSDLDEENPGSLTQPTAAAAVAAAAREPRPLPLAASGLDASATSSAEDAPPLWTSLPPLRRPAPPSPGSPGAAQRRQPSPVLGDRSSDREQHGASPARRLGSACAMPARSMADLQVTARPASAWADAGHEAQVLLARARGAIQRRGNWLQAFVRHDVTGEGLLACEQFEAFLVSLSLGLSRQEAHLVAEALARSSGSGSGGVSLGGFSEAITNAVPSEQGFGEQWALDMVSPLADSLPRGLASNIGRDQREVLADLPSPPPELGISAAGAMERLLLWLPKTPEGAVDWQAAEAWRSSWMAPSRR